RDLLKMLLSYTHSVGHIPHVDQHVRIRCQQRLERNSRIRRRTCRERILSIRDLYQLIEKRIASDGDDPIEPSRRSADDEDQRTSRMRTGATPNRIKATTYFSSESTAAIGNAARFRDLLNRVKRMLERPLLELERPHLRLHQPRCDGIASRLHNHQIRPQRR